MSVELHQLADENSAVDLTKLCVEYALRIGLVGETSWLDLLKSVLNHPSKRFIWTKPQAPVFFALTQGQQLDFTKPARFGQQYTFL
jgi:hypothetical protein